MSEVKFSALAYCKLILHAVKYPHASVNGVLLASEDSKRGDSLLVEDIVPLFHSALTLAPMAEVALQQVICLNFYLHVEIRLNSRVFTDRQLRQQK
jgi:ER membrane protein complex subunit 8/9